MIAPGSRVGVYEVTALIGSGGMGEVYRARDPKLGRDVAIKVLPRAFSDDADRYARFDREARLLASLNHPHIATIYGFEHAGEVRAIILELVEGPTLAERIRRPLSPKEAVSIACQIAAALDAAHEKGIVHRDLKPANIKLTAEGAVKVLDFGIAKALFPATGPVRSDTPTFTAVDTRVGAIVGTAAYMSPEQARGLPVDKRTDIWAFGCVLYELLTGHSAFAGQTPSDTIAAILEREPDWAGLPDSSPPGLRRLLRRCLTKDLKQRFRDVGDVRAELQDIFEPGPEMGTGAAPPRVGHHVMPWLLALLCLAAATVLAVQGWRVTRGGEASAASITRATVTLPTNQELDTRDTASPLALSPDGRRLVYVARTEGRTQLHLRSLDSFEARPMAGTEEARYPFFSPDGQSVAFFAGGKLLRVSVQGGSPVTICDSPVIGQGATWGPDGTIVFASGDAGLMQVPATGGRAVPITTRDGETDSRRWTWPQFLPGGRDLLATAGLQFDAALVVLSLKTGTWRELGRGFQAQYVPSGHLIFHALAEREGEIRAVRFDPETLTIGGTPVPVLDGVFRSENGGGAYYAVARSGTLIFAPGGHARTLVRVDRNGRRTPLLDDRRGYRMPRVSPDGRYVALTIDPRPSQVWVYDLSRKTGLPLATDGHSLLPVWTPDGRRVTYISRQDLFWRPADGAGTRSVCSRAIARNTQRRGPGMDVSSSSPTINRRTGRTSGPCPWAAIRIRSLRPARTSSGPGCRLTTAGSRTRRTSRGGSRCTFGPFRPSIAASGWCRRTAA